MMKICFLFYLTIKPCRCGSPDARWDPFQTRLTSLEDLVCNTDQLLSLTFYQTFIQSDLQFLHIRCFAQGHFNLLLSLTLIQVFQQNNVSRSWVTELPDEVMILGLRLNPLFYSLNWKPVSLESTWNPSVPDEDLLLYSISYKLWSLINRNRWL